MSRPLPQWQRPVGLQDPLSELAATGPSQHKLMLGPSQADVKQVPVRFLVTAHRIRELVHGREDDYGKLQTFR